MNLQDIMQFLDENAPAFLATLGTCGNPRIRPVQSPLLFGDKIYFCTGKSKNLYKHMQKHSGVEFCSCAKDGTFLRLRGQGVFVDDKEIKRAMFEKYPLVKDIYKDIENENFAIFYLDKISARKQKMNGEFELFKENESSCCNA